MQAELRSGENADRAPWLWGFCLPELKTCLWVPRILAFPSLMKPSQARSKQDQGRKEDSQCVCCSLEEGDPGRSVPVLRGPRSHVPSSPSVRLGSLLALSSDVSPASPCGPRPPDDGGPHSWCCSRSQATCLFQSSCSPYLRPRLQVPTSPLPVLFRFPRRRPGPCDPTSGEERTEHVLLLDFLKIKCILFIKHGLRR